VVYFLIFLKKKDKNKLFGFGSNFNGELGDFNQHQLRPIEINILKEKKIMKLRTGGSHVTLLLGTFTSFSSNRRPILVFLWVE
jgi:hypothetical protein